MNWKEIDLVDPLRRPILAIGKKPAQVSNLLSLLNATNSIEDTVLDYLKTEWSNLCGPAAKRSMPIKIELNNLFISSESASSRQDIVMRWPKIQKQIQQRFSYQLKSVRFHTYSEFQTKIDLYPKSKIDKIKPKKSDIANKDLSFIQDIREILNI